jgi:hypothetical protein
MKTRPSFGAVRLTKGNRAARLGARVALAFLFVCCRPHFAAAANSASVSISRGLPFVVADFDGDHRPDFASVQTGAAGASSAHYLVRFRLSTSGKRYVQVTAPRGGIRLEARDVNGDQFPDLVVASPWLDKPVLILLNDGHGNFSQVNPAAFPQAFGESSASWNSSDHTYSCALALPRDASSGEIPLAFCTECLLRTREFPRFPRERRISIRPIALSAGRAPPARLWL